MFGLFKPIPSLCNRFSILWVPWVIAYIKFALLTGETNSESEFGIMWAPFYFSHQSVEHVLVVWKTYQVLWQSETLENTQRKQFFHNECNMWSKCQGTKWGRKAFECHPLGCSKHNYFYTKNWIQKIFQQHVLLFGKLHLTACFRIPGECRPSMLFEIPDNKAGAKLWSFTAFKIITPWTQVLLGSELPVIIL